MDRKEARKILGVTKEASRSDIEKKYTILLKKYRQGLLGDSSAKAESGDAPDATAQTGEETVAGSAAVSDQEFDRITEAYNVLMGYDVEIKEEPPGKAAPILKKIGVDEKKARNFFYYYKYHILGAIALIIGIVYFISSCVNRVVYDFNIAFIGNIYYYDATDYLRESIKANIPVITEPGFDGAFISGTAGEQQYAMEMKATVLFAAGEVDVYILDRDCYERYAKHGAFMNLDEIAPRLGVDVSEHQDLIFAMEENDGTEDIEGPDAGQADTDNGTKAGEESGEPTGEKHLYGIDVSNSKVLKEAGVIAPNMVAAIFAGCEQQEKAEAFLEFLLNN